MDLRPAYVRNDELSSIEAFSGNAFSYYFAYTKLNFSFYRNAFLTNVFSGCAVQIWKDMNGQGESFICASPAYVMPWNGPSGKFSGSKQSVDQSSQICDYTGSRIALQGLLSAGNFYMVGNDEASSVKCSCQENSFF